MASHPGAVSPSPQDVKAILGTKVARPTLEPLSSSASIKRTGPLSPALSELDDEYAHSLSPNSPTRPLAAISENEDAGDDDSDVEVEHARAEGMQGMRKEADIKSGYLMKKGERRKAWKKRYFVLRAKRICYYKDEKEYKLLRDVPLDNVSTVAEVQVKRHENVFGIVTAQRTYYVEARSHADMKAWVSAIEEARDEFKRTKSEETSITTQTGPETPIVKPPPQAVQAQARTQPISIIGPGSPGPATSTSTPFSSSVATSVATSPFSPDGGSSSYTSQASTMSSLPPHVPPNSLITGGAGLLGNPVELTSVDERLESRQRQNSNASSGEATSPPSTAAGYFRPRPASPGIASSSEDEDDDYFPTEGSTPGPGTTAGLGPTASLHFGSLDPNKVIMSGYLTKQGKRKNWRKRYFILVSSRLMYSRSHMDQKIHRQIPLARILDVVDVVAPTMGNRGSRSHSTVGDAGSPDPGNVSSSGLGGRYDNSFRIITAKRTFTVCAPDEESEIKWISAIKVLLNAQRQSQAHPSATAAAAKVSSTPSTSVGADLPPPVGTSPVSSPSLAPAHHSSPPAATRTPSSTALPSIETRMEQASLGTDGLPRAPTHNRQRSATDAAKLAVREAGERYSAKA